MNATPVHARLINAGGELIAEGPCWLDEAGGQATLEPERSVATIHTEHGPFSLELESGRSFPVSDRPMVVRIAPPGRTTESIDRRSLFRLRLLKRGSTGLAQSAQDAAAAGGMGEGTPTLRFGGETPAAR